MKHQAEIIITFKDNLVISEDIKPRIIQILTPILSTHLSTNGNQPAIELEVSSLVKPNDKITGFRFEVLNPGNHQFELNDVYWYGPWLMTDKYYNMAASKMPEYNANLSVSCVEGEQIEKFHIYCGNYYFKPVEIVLLRGASQQKYKTMQEKNNT